MSRMNMKRWTLTGLVSLIGIVLFAGGCDNATDSESHDGGHANMTEHRHLPATGPLVGAIEDACWTSNQLTLHDTDRLWLYTDGITEAGAPGNALGDDGLQRSLDLTVAATLQDQADTLLRESSSRWSEDPDDDATLLAIECFAMTLSSPSGDERYSVAASGSTASSGSTGSVGSKPICLPTSISICASFF